MRKLWLVAVAFLVFAFAMFGVMAPQAHAAAIASTGTGGAWNSPGTWTGNIIPAGGDAVTITTGATVDIAAGQMISSLLSKAKQTVTGSWELYPLQWYF